MNAGMPSLTCMAAWPIGKWSEVNAESCIVSLNRHGPAANPGPGRPAPRGIRAQLCQFGPAGRGPDDRGREATEQRGGSIAGRLLVRADDLGQGAELLD